MSYEPKAGDEIKFKRIGTWNLARVYRVDQVVLTDEGSILGVVIHPVSKGRNLKPMLYDLATFEKFWPVKVTHGGQIESTPEA